MNRQTQIESIVGSPTKLRGDTQVASTTSIVSRKSYDGFVNIAVLKRSNCQLSLAEISSGTKTE